MLLPHFNGAQALLILSILANSGLSAAAETALPEVTVQDQGELADGRVKGYRAERTFTVTRTDTPLRDVPASVSVVPADLMKDQAMQGMADAIRYVPGASIHQGEGNRDQFILRGNSAGTDMYVDGIRDDAQVFRDLYNLERIDVLKGAGSTTFGRGGAGGAINRVTKKPAFGHVGEAGFSFGSHDQLRATVDVGAKVGDSAAWRLNAMLEGADSFRDGASMKRQAINPTISLIPGPLTVLTLGIEHLRDERTADRGIPSQNGQPFETGRGTFFGNPDQSSAHGYIDSAYAILDHDFGDSQLKNNLRVTRYDKFYQNVFPATGTAVTTTGVATINAYNNANNRTNIFNQTDLITQFKTGVIEHTLLAGLELGRQDSTTRRQTGFFNLADCLAGSTTTNCRVSAASPRVAAASFRPNGTDNDNNVKADIVALYVQDQIALSSEWKLLAGLRYDYFNVRFDDRRSTTAPIDLDHTDKEFSPRLGVTWSPTRASTYYASYSHSFLPSAEALSLAVNNANLDPESAENLEIGTRWDLSEKLTFSVAAYRLDRNNQRNADGNGGLVLTGQTRTKGVELGLQGEVTRDWSIYAGYSSLDARITKATTAQGNQGNRPQLTPANALSLWNRVNLGQRWSAGLGIIHQGASYPNVDNLVSLPAFTRADGAIYYNFIDSKTRLALNVENLFNRKYYPTADANNNISPGAPRNGRLTLSTSF